MFNLSEQVNRLQRLEHSKIHGLPHKKKHYDSKVKQVDGTPFEQTANIEHVAILNSFKNKSLDFGRRLSKAKGQYHKPGGGLALHTERG